ncbi:Hypothetical protein D9617_7g030480 [Elsinoe fawcettii]|nr:Hypothetical protein D9617_7g030480 [Elsinoe fawcettii]
MTDQEIYLSTLSTSHNLLSLNITSSNPIAARATTILKHFHPTTDDNTKSRPLLVCLSARASAANKLITITEIVKRQLATEKVKVYQYSMLGSEMITLKPKPDAAKAKDSARGGEEGEESEGEAFETMGKKKVRNVPTLTVYLCLESVARLRKGYGEQTNMDGS